MTMAYLASFDIHDIGGGTITLSTAGESDISVNLNTYDAANWFGTLTTKFNHVLNSGYDSFDLFAQNKLLTLPTLGLLDQLTLEFRAAATTATWSSPSSINISINTTTWLVTFSYAGSFTAIQFGNTETRRLFGFAGNFSGSSASVTGSDVPKYILVPDVDGASNATPVYELGATSSAAYSGGGRPYGLTRSSSKTQRDWVQQYETKGKVFRPFALSIPNEFTWQHFFEQGRAGTPWAVYGGFGDDQFEAYAFRAGDEAFHPYPATPGNANQFHIPFRTYALGRP
jgi:hypothetical protein